MEEANDNTGALVLLFDGICNLCNGTVHFSSDEIFASVCGSLPCNPKQDNAS